MSNSMNSDSNLVVNEGRRDLLKAGAALTLAVTLPSVGRTQETSGASVVKEGAWDANAFVRITPDNKVTIIAKHLEMGQGVNTGLATIVAEELDADWSQIRVEGAPVDAKRYGNKLLGGGQGTGGSTSIAGSYDLMRDAGAKARAMLVGAAAKQWNVPAAEITVSKGVVSHAASKKSAKFGELVAAASQLPVPTEVKLKDPKSFTLIGKNAARVDSWAKSNGTAIFTQDFKLPGMLTAVVSHPPLFGGKVKSFDATKAKAIKGVVDVVKFDTGVTTGVAVLAKDFWSAKKGRDALTVEWDDSAAFKQGTADIMAQYKELAKNPGKSMRKEGDVAAAFASAAKVVEAEYEFPYLAHASMEPMNCVVQIGDDSCEVWNGEQFQAIDAPSIAKVVGMSPAKVKINALYAGGSFGRRANPMADYPMEAAAIAKAANTKAPVKLVWTREDDTRGGMYRPMYFHKMRAGLDAQGNIVAWEHRIVGQQIMAGADQMSTEGASSLPYAIPNISVDLHSTKQPVTVQWWRSVGSTHTAYSTECFLDDVARAAGKDPVALRRTLLAKHPRHLAALNLAVEKSGWGKPLANGKVRGIAVHESFNTVVAQVVEVARAGEGYKLERVVCAVDCGLAVNPNIVAMQMESGIGYGLSAALTGAVTLKEGRVEQSNFHDYTVLRMNQMPKIDVHIVPSTAAPTGVGEPGTPPIAPALANAIATMSGKSIRTLPLSSQKVKVNA
jgi:isoquinoline 1-oxidoreductase beta subunit